MFLADGGLQDTIVARATAPGAAARAVLRISGEAALAVAAAVFRPDAGSLAGAAPLTVVPGRIEIDDARVPAFAIRFARGRSFTGEDLVELHLPGAPPLVERALAALGGAGARPARPGEFTRRAFLEGRIDLAGAEAVLALSQAATESEARAAALALRGRLTHEVEAIRRSLLDALADLEAAIDFAHEDLEQELIARAGTADALAGAAAALDALLASEAGRGAGDRAPVVVLYGPPNAGKSSLLNALAGAPRALTAPIAGTTRDAVATVVRVGAGVPAAVRAEAGSSGRADAGATDLAIELVDVAGVDGAGVDGAGAGEGTSGLEGQAAARARDLMRAADLVLVVLDGSRPHGAAERAALEETAPRPRLVLRAKADLPSAWTEEAAATGTEAAATEGGAAPPSPVSAVPALISALPVSALPVSALPISARTGAGLDGLRAAIAARLARGPATEAAGVGPNARHRSCLERARARLGAAIGALGGGAPPDLASIDIRAALDALGEVGGASAADDVLERIFARFCIGK